MAKRKNTYRQDEALETPFDIRHLKRSWKYIKAYKGKMALALVLSAAASVTGLFAPIITQKVLDDAVPGKNISMLLLLAAALVGVYAVSTVFSTLRSRIMIRVSQKIIYTIRKDLFAHLQELPFQYYDDRPHGKILIRVVNYVNSVSDMLSNGLINVILEIFNLIFIIIFMFSVDAELSLVTMAGVPVLAVAVERLALVLPVAVVPLALVLAVAEERQVWDVSWVFRSFGRTLR